MQAAEGRQQWTLTFGSSEIQSRAAGSTSERAIHSATPAGFQRHDVTLTLLAVLGDSLCSNCGFLKTGLVEYIQMTYLQAPMTSI